MLKRYRGSSPTPSPPEPTVEAEESPYDLYEPDPKRRRYFAPSTSTQWHGVANDGEEDYAESGDEVRTLDFKYNESKSRRREWQAAAGEYKDANSLLHDLHAEQRHRILFSSSSQTTSNPPSYHQHYTTSSPIAPAVRTKNVPLLIAEPHVVYPVQYDPMKHGFPDSETDGVQEAALVSQRYENTNKFLRSLILSRRQDGGQ